jgi:hypothetical protein
MMYSNAAMAGPRVGYAMPYAQGQGPYMMPQPYMQPMPGVIPHFYPVQMLMKPRVSFTMNNGSLSDRSLPVVVEQLRADTTVRLLSLTNNELGNGCIPLLAEELLTTMFHITHVDLSGNFIGDQGAVALAELLAKRKAMGNPLTLRIFDNVITEDGFAALKPHDPAGEFAVPIRPMASSGNPRNLRKLQRAATLKLFTKPHLVRDGAVVGACCWRWRPVLRGCTRADDEAGVVSKEP